MRERGVKREEGKEGGKEGKREGREGREGERGRREGMGGTHCGGRSGPAALQHAIKSGHHWCVLLRNGGLLDGGRRSSLERSEREGRGEN